MVCFLDIKIYWGETGKKTKQCWTISCLLSKTNDSLTPRRNLLKNNLQLQNNIKLNGSLSRFFFQNYHHTFIVKQRQDQKLLEQRATCVTVPSKTSQNWKWCLCHVSLVKLWFGWGTTTLGSVKGEIMARTFLKICASMTPICDRLRSVVAASIRGVVHWQHS